MGASTSQGTGPGSASNIKPLIFNGTVLSGNLGPDAALESMSGERKLLSVTASSLSLTASDHAGKVVVLNNAAGVTVTGYVSAADTVTLRLQNESAGTVDLASTTIKLVVARLG